MCISLYSIGNKQQIQLELPGGLAWCVYPPPDTILAYSSHHKFNPGFPNIPIPNTPIGPKSPTWAWKLWFFRFFCFSSRVFCFYGWAPLLSLLFCFLPMPFWLFLRNKQKAQGKSKKLSLMPILSLYRYRCVYTYTCPTPLAPYHYLVTSPYIALGISNKLH